MGLSGWLTNNWIEIFGAVAGILYVFLEIRQNLWLWPVGIITSAVYIWIFFTSKLYADMSLQAYYVVISILGWHWWVKGAERRAQGTGQGLTVTRIRLKLAVILFTVFLGLYTGMFLILSRLTDSPVPGWDSFLTSLSIIATWMLARKIYEQWYLWIAVNTASAVLCFTRGLFPTVILYTVYATMSFIGLGAWKKTITENNPAR